MSNRNGIPRRVLRALAVIAVASVLLACRQSSVPVEGAWAIEVREALRPELVGRPVVVSYVVAGDRWRITRRVPGGILEEHLVTPTDHWFHLAEVMATELGIEPVWVHIDGDRLDALPAGTAATLRGFRVRPDRDGLAADGEVVEADLTLLAPPEHAIDVTEFAAHLATSIR